MTQPADYSRRTFLRCGSAALLSAVGYEAVPRRVWGLDQPAPRPNFVFIFADDLGWKDTGYMGSTYYETPNIDRLAREGMIFTNAYANAPNCAPSRACLMSGQYTPRHGVYTVGTSERGKSQDRKLIPIPNTTTLDPKIVTIAERLKQVGYATAHVGKWHLGQDPDTGPKAQGFDRNIGGVSPGHRPNYFSPYNADTLADGPQGEYLTDRLTDEAVQFIEAHRDRPFYLYLSHYAVHTPHQAKEDKIAHFKDKQGNEFHHDPTYAAMIASLDDSVGRVLDTLDRLNLAENTVVVFFSDNGGYGPITSMAPLRGAKGMLYEGGIREPAVVRWKGTVQGGSVCDVPTIGVDYYPTFMELAGVKNGPRQIRDGESLVPLWLQTGGLQREALYWHFPVYLEGYRRKDGTWRTTPAGAIRQGDFKLIEFFEDGTLELYNLKDDIGETHNLAEEFPEKTKELHGRLKAWRESLNAPVPTERNPEYVSSP